MRLKRFAATVAAMLFVIAFLASDSHAQKIYLLTTVDTSQYEKGRNIGPGGLASQGIIRSAFGMNVPEEQLVLYGDSENATPWLGPDVSDNAPDMARKWIEAIKKCPAGPNDTIVFFGAMHGGSQNGEHYLSIPGDKGLIPRKRLSEELRKKKVRLAVLMTESCSSIIQGSISDFELPCAVELKEISPLFRSLFIDARGMVDFNSSTEPEYGMFLSYTTPTGEVEGLGGIMGLAMQSIISEYAQKEMTWTKFKDLLTQKQDELFKKSYPDGLLHEETNWVQRTQTPHFFSLPGKGSGDWNRKRHCCFLKRLFQRLHCKHHRCCRYKTYRVRAECCR